MAPIETSVVESSPKHLGLAREGWRRVRVQKREGQKAIVILQEPPQVTALRWLANVTTDRMTVAV